MLPQGTCTAVTVQLSSRVPPQPAGYVYVYAVRVQAMATRFDLSERGR